MSILDIFKETVKPKITAKIISKQDDTLCAVRDAKNRRYLVESDGSYNVGQTVSIKDGVIIGTAKSLGTLKGYIV